MNKVMCPRHGSVIGILACPEICAAAAANTPPPPHSKLSVDCSGEAPPGHMLTFLACAKCIAEFRLEEAAKVPWATFWDATAMPSLVPVCPVCVGTEDLTLVGANDEG